MITSHIQKSQYQTFLEHEFSAIFSDCNDNAPINPLSPDIINRQEILYMQFDMEKKGKNFGISQWRLLKIEGESLFQVDKNQQEKAIPIPNSIIIVRKIDDHEEWEEKYAQFEAKIVMKFTGRTDITVFFRSVIECNEIAMFLTYKIREGVKRNFNASASLFKQRIVNEMVKKIQLSKEEMNSFRNGKIKAKLNEHFKRHLNDRTCITNFLESWKARALFPQNAFSFTLTLKQLDFTFQNYLGAMKIWVQNAVKKYIAITNQNTVLEVFDSHKTILFDQSFSEEIIDLRAQQELQIQCQINGVIWKSQRFNANDLKKMALTHPKIKLNLVNKGEISYLKIQVAFRNAYIIPFNEKISPKHYRVIDELYKKDEERFELAKIHQHYTSILQQQRKNTFYYASFNKLKQLITMLKLQELIDKFYTVEPFKAFANTEFKATFIYEYFLRNYEKQQYYEIEKLMWRYQQKTYKRILTALKVFDENPKFNFTDSFFHLVKRMHEIASRESSNRWKQGLFSKNLKGIESITFFLSIGVIKTFSSIFIYQQAVNKRALPYNSLLFIFTFRKSFPAIFDKINKLELNLQAYFGCHFANLFCKLFEGEMFSRILILLLSQKKEDGQPQYLYTLIAVFMTIISAIDSYKCSYASAEHYIITFQEYCKDIEDKFSFFSQVQRWKAIVQQQSAKREYKELSTAMTDFYVSNAYSGQLGEISKQIYQQFTCYHYKNENDLRKILIFIDKINIGPQQDTQNITLSIFQSASKLYEHQFKGINLNQIGHFIEIKLIKLQQLTIICNTPTNSYSCRLDPKEVSSNLYFHFVKPLILTYHLSPQLNRHIFFQAYIKDNCEIDSLQNPIPIKYNEVMLEKGLSKQQILFCKKFNKTFRMRENNFNLLYSKLGWFGNHYLIPDQRLINIEIMGFRSGGKEELHSRIALMNKSTRAIYGKALSPYPNEPRKLSVELIKENIHTDYEPSSSLKASLNEANTYNSASRLLCYELDNFYIPTSMQFLQFYYQMNEKLPLIRYLSYHPKLFYLLPTFTLQVSTYNSVCTIIISSNGIPFLTQFTVDQMHSIEEKAMDYNRLPQQIEFSYTDKDMYFDDFLVLLRLNILKRIIALDKKDKKGKAKRWANSLSSISVLVPNYKLHHFYQVMNETKQIIQLEFKELKRLKQRIQYKDYGLVGNKWIKVYCISLLKTSQQLYYYVLSEFQRKKYILKQSDFIIVDQQQKKTVSLSDDIANSMEIITYQLSQIFEI